MTREMKDSGIEWIGEMPRDWKVSQVKHLFEIGRGRVISKEELSYTEENGYPVYSSQTKNDGILGYIGTYDFTDNMLTWTTDGANAGTIFKRTGKYSCTNVCGTLRVKDNLIESIDLNYAYYALYIGAPYYKRKDTNGFKIMNNEMAIIKFPFPDLKKQQKIVNILDTKVNSIEKIIRKTHLSIVELKKYKQSLITEAVTKGLNPKVEMKDSGIEWIGKIPKHWEINKLKRLSISYSGGTPSRSMDSYWENGTISWVSSGEVNKEVIFDTKEKITNLGLENSSAKLFPKNTVIVALNGQGKTKGKSAILKIEACTNQSLVGFITDSFKLNYKYLNYLFISSYKYNRSYYAGGNNREGIAASDLRDKKIPVPPLDEQIKICSFLDKQTNSIEKLIEDKHKLINELESYKKSLIYEYVTGKKEV